MNRTPQNKPYKLWGNAISRNFFLQKKPYNRLLKEKIEKEQEVKSVKEFGNYNILSKRSDLFRALFHLEPDGEKKMFNIKKDANFSNPFFVSRATETFNDINEFMPNKNV